MNDVNANGKSQNCVRNISLQDATHCAIVPCEMENKRKKDLSTTGSVRLPKAIVQDFIEFMQGYPASITAGEVLAAGIVAFSRLGIDAQLELVDEIKSWDILKLKGQVQESREKKGASVVAKNPLVAAFQAVTQGSVRSQKDRPSKGKEAG